MKTILITGGARGLGKAIVKRLKSEDYNIIIHYNKSKQAALKLQKEIPNSICLQADLTNFKEVEKMFELIWKNFKSIDTIVNCAGISLVSQFQDITPTEWKNIFDLNVGGIYNVLHFALPNMISNKKGNILNVSSMWGENGASCETAYAASKGAVNALTKSLALELAPSNIRVNAVAPGPIATDMMSTYSKENLELIKDDIPLNKIAQPSEIAELICFLISDKNSYMTGQIISCDGGMCV